MTDTIIQDKTTIVKVTVAEEQAAIVAGHDVRDAIWSKTHDDIWDYLGDLLLAKKITGLDVKVYGKLIGHLNKHGLDVYPSDERLGKLVKADRRTISKSLGRLKSVGLLDWEPRGRGKKYTLYGVAKGKKNNPVMPGRGDLYTKDGQGCTNPADPICTKSETDMYTNDPITGVDMYMSVGKTSTLTRVEQEEQECKATPTFSNPATQASPTGQVVEESSAAPRGPQSWSPDEEAVYAALIAEWPFIPHEGRTKKFIALALEGNKTGKTLTKFIQSVRQNPSLMNSVNRAGLFPQNLIPIWHMVFADPHKKVGYRPHTAL